MSDLIKRQDAIDALNECEDIKGYSYRQMHDALMEIPSADRPQGEWEAQVDADGLHVICSACGQDSDFSPYYKAYKYCPHCGARMKGANDAVDAV